MHRDPKSKARAALVWTLACSLGIQFGLTIAIEIWLPGLGDPVYAFRVARLRRHFNEKRAAARPGTRIIALGSSRTMFGIDAAGLGSDLTTATGHATAVFNFGVVGAGPITELLYLRKLLHDGVVPDLVLIEVLPPFLAGQLTPPAEARWFLPGTRLGFYERNLLARFGFPAQNLEWTGWRSWLLPFYAHRRTLLSRIGPSWLPFALQFNERQAADSAGWVSRLPAAPGRLLLETADRDHFAACFDGFQPEGAPVDALEELLTVCRQAHVRVVLLLMPETSLFRSWYPAEMEDRLGAFLDRLAVPRIDARGWIADDGFLDANHLHPGGAAILRQKLAEALLPLVKSH